MYTYAYTRIHASVNARVTLHVRAAMVRYMYSQPTVPCIIAGRCPHTFMLVHYRGQQSERSWQVLLWLPLYKFMPSASGVQIASMQALGVRAGVSYSNGEGA